MAQLEIVERDTFNDLQEGYLKTLAALPGLGMENS